jgi:hypothetical protein
MVEDWIAPKANLKALILNKSFLEKPPFKNHSTDNPPPPSKKKIDDIVNYILIIWNSVIPGNMLIYVFHSSHTLLFFCVIDKNVKCKIYEEGAKDGFPTN